MCRLFLVLVSLQNKLKDEMVYAISVGDEEDVTLHVEEIYKNQHPEKDIDRIRVHVIGGCGDFQCPNLTVFKPTGTFLIKTDRMSTTLKDMAVKGLESGEITKHPYSIGFVLSVSVIGILMATLIWTCS